VKLTNEWQTSAIFNSSSLDKKCKETYTIDSNAIGRLQNEWNCINGSFSKMLATVLQIIADFQTVVTTEHNIIL
jgi:hypothetical protein